MFGRVVFVLGALVFAALPVFAETSSVASTTATAPASSSSSLSLPNIGATLQVWALSEDHSGFGENVRLRRAELKLSGNVVESTRWFLMVDAAKAISSNSNGDTKILQDLGLGYSPITGFEFVVGQFKTPTTIEGTDSSSELLFPERSISGRTFGDKREPGLMATYKSEDFGKFSAMLSNGQGGNADAAAGSKKLTARYDRNIVDSLKAGAFFQAVDFKTDTYTWGANVSYAPESFVLGGEVASLTTQAVASTGFTGYVGYFVTPEIQPVARVEYIKLGSNLDSGMGESLGVNYLIKGNKAKISLAVEHLGNLSAPNGTPSYSLGSNGTLITSAFQMVL